CEEGGNYIIIIIIISSSSSSSTKTLQLNSPKTRAQIPPQRYKNDARSVFSFVPIISSAIDREEADTIASTRSIQSSMRLALNRNRTTVVPNPSTIARHSSFELRTSSCVTLFMSQTTVMSFLPPGVADGRLHGFEFTFEAIPDKSSLHDSHIEVDPDPHEGETESLPDDVECFPRHFGRTYHAYRAGSYVFPNDPAEQERLDLQSLALTELFSGRLHFAPIAVEGSPKRILDVGTGTGAWAMDMGDVYPEAKIVGIDLSPIQSNAVPPNVHFYIEDAAQSWQWEEPFDYVHTRVLLGSFGDFKNEVIRQAFDSLRPGGWLESQDFNLEATSDDDTLAPDSPLSRWVDDMNLASEMIGRPLSRAHMLREWYEEVGFVDVHQRVFKIPINGWAKHPRHKHVGRLWEQNFLDGLSGFSMALFTQVLERQQEEVQVSLVDVRRDISNMQIHAYQHVWVVWGRKPYPDEAIPAQSPSENKEMTD
ncbi:methyltransferase, partial [Colletotrichum limetticola]